MIGQALAVYNIYAMGLVTTKEAAQILGVTAARVRQLIKDGRLIAEKRGRDHLLEDREVERFKRHETSVDRREAGHDGTALERTIACAIVLRQFGGMKQAEDNVCLAAESPLELASRLGEQGCAALAADYRSSMGQFLTPPKVAALLARMFGPAEGDVRLLDLGAGVEALAAAFVEDVLQREPKPRSLHLTAWELEKEFVGRLGQVLERCAEAARAAGVPTVYEIKCGDALKEGAALVDEDDLFRGVRPSHGFTHAIMNPPYRKLTRIRRQGVTATNGAGKFRTSTRGSSGWLRGSLCRRGRWWRLRLGVSATDRDSWRSAAPFEWMAAFNRMPVRAAGHAYLPRMMCYRKT